MTTKDDFAAIFSASNAIPQGLSQIKQHSPSWRYLLQTIRNASDNRNPGDYELARIYQASIPITVIDGSSPYADSSAKLLRIINTKSEKFTVTSEIYDVVPYKYGEFLIGGLAASEVPADGEPVVVLLPTIYDAKGVICLGEWEHQEDA
jgi:hypothetical protein